MGAELIGSNFVAPFTGGAWSYNPGAAATLGYWRFDSNAEWIMISLDMGDLFENNADAGDLIIEVEMDATNDTDRFDYALYNCCGDLLEENTDIEIGTATKDWIQLGSGFGDHIVSGDVLVLVIGIFETNVGGNTTVDVFRIKVTYRLGIQSN